MSYRVEFDGNPNYELCLSMYIYCKGTWTRNIDRGTEWMKEVDSTLSTDFSTQLDNCKELPFYEYLYLLVSKHAQSNSSATFIDWLHSLKVGQLFEILAPYVKNENLPAHLEQIQNQWVDLLSRWNEQYFDKIHNQYSRIMERDIVEKRALCHNLNPMETVEECSNGVILIPVEEVKEVLLVPTFHFSPLNNLSYFNGLTIVQYAAEIPRDNLDLPSTKLMRMTRALADENRIRTLRFLSQKPRSFAEIVEYLGITKGTVSHHLLLLRSAGLVSFTDYSNCSRQVKYQLRTGGIKKYYFFLQEFVGV